MAVIPCSRVVVLRVGECVGCVWRAGAVVGAPVPGGRRVAAVRRRRGAAGASTGGGAAGARHRAGWVAGWWRRGRWVACRLVWRGGGVVARSGGRRDQGPVAAVEGGRRALPARRGGWGVAGWVVAECGVRWCRGAGAAGGARGAARERAEPLRRWCGELEAVGAARRAGLGRRVGRRRRRTGWGVSWRGAAGVWRALVVALRVRGTDRAGSPGGGAASARVPCALGRRCGGGEAAGGAIKGRWQRRRVVGGRSRRVVR